MSDNDDQQIGRILSRREVLALLGAVGTAMLAGCAPQASSSLATATPVAAPTSAPAAVANDAPAAVAVPDCVVRPEVTEGPYYVAEELNRSDVRSDPSSGAVKAGAPLRLTFNVAQVAGGSCAALAGAKVEIWHCDAAGSYSDVTDRSADTRGQQFLRGYQLTDARGQATFTTIYPGWYPGRAVHIHFKVHRDGGPQSAVFTSQVFFDDALSDQVFAQAPYAERGQRNVLNSNDGIYRQELLVAAAPAGDGYAATFAIGLEAA